MDPLKDKRFLKYLIMFGVLVMSCWIVFSGWILPMLPNTPLKGGLATLGGGVILVVCALLVIRAYEAGE